MCLSVVNNGGFRLLSATAAHYVKI